VHDLPQRAHQVFKPFVQSLLKVLEISGFAGIRTTIQLAYEVANHFIAIPQKFPNNPVKKGFSGCKGLGRRRGSLALCYGDSGHIQDELSYSFVELVPVIM
jgi:hypothetical protein